MKKIDSISELCTIVSDAIAGKKQNKPVLIWFLGNAGRSNTLIDRFNREYVNTNPSIHKENLGGVIRQTTKAVIVFHRYLGQMEEAYLRDIIETKKQSCVPVFLLANSYEIDNKPSWVEREFDEIIYTEEVDTE